MNGSSRRHFMNNPHLTVLTQPRDSYYFYRVFGLGLHSDRPIAGLVATAESAAGLVDVSIRFGEWPDKHRVSADLSAAPFYRSPFRDESGRPVVSAWQVLGGVYLRLLMSDGLECVIDGGGTEIWVDAPGVSDADVAECLLGPILGIALRRHGIVCLHASAVEIDGRAVAFAGRQGAGKSTLAALFAMRGCPVIADDLSALIDGGDTMVVQPGAPYLRMRPGAAEASAGRLGRRADLKPSPDRLYLDLDLRAPGYRARSSPLLLGGVYCLDWSSPPAGGEPRLEPMTGADAVMSLISDTWATRLLDGLKRAAELDVLARLVNQVPVRRIVQVESQAVLELADRILDDVRHLARDAGPVCA
jgi:hypothetical protein